MSTTTDYQTLLNFYKKTGGKPEVFTNSKIAHLLVHKNKIYRASSIEGLIIKSKEKKQGLDIDLEAEKNFKAVHPIHLCFGVLPKIEIQKINIKANFKTGSNVSILAHCLFPNAQKVKHIMNAEFEIGKNAILNYNEIHYHGELGGTEVAPSAKIKIKKGGQLKTLFSLLKGRVGKLKIDYEVLAEKEAVVEMIAKIYGYQDDKIKIREKATLQGEKSRGLIQSRVVVKDKAQSSVISELFAKAPLARGHIDCIEIVQGKAKAEAIPLVSVANEKAKVTHESAIGSLDKKELETLMARGLTYSEATDFIVGGLLR